MEYLQHFLSPNILALTILPLVLLLFLYRHVISKPKPGNTTPEAAGALPIIGHLHHLSGPKPAHKTLGLMAEKHGPIFAIRIGVHRALIVSSWEIARECFTTNDKAFADRPRFVASETMTYDFAFFGFGPYGQYWRQIRKLATLELLSNHRLETLRRVRESEVGAAVSELYGHGNKGNEKSGETTEMKKWFGDLSLNVVFRIVFGGSYLEVTGGGGGGDRCQKALRDFFDFMGSFTVSDAVPWLRWLDLGGHERAMRATMRELDGLAQRCLDEHKEKRKREADDNISGVVSNRDFMDVLLSILDGAEIGDSRYDADTIIKATSLNMVLAASDTTMITMTWALALLLNNRETLKKVQQELDEQVGRERQVKESDIKNLIYLQAAVKETLRLYPAGPLSVPHESTEDCTIAGRHVPARTRLFVNLSRLQRDPRVWARPDEFRPERFLAGGEAEGFDVRGQSFELIPFGSGRRMCPGVSFALQVTHLSLAALIHGFEIATPGDEDVDMTESAGLTNLKASTLNVLLTPRLPAEAY